MNKNRDLAAKEKVKGSSQKARQQFEEDLVQNVTSDFEQRRIMRQNFELQWQLNANFLMGNQYCTVSPTGEIEEDQRSYYWQHKEVYNHIAPIIETRMAKLGRAKPVMSVRSASSDDDDLYAAKMSSKILESVFQKHNVSELISQATMWSEVCGTSFYKVTWNANAGNLLGAQEGKRVFDGDIEFTVCPPYEIYPDSNSREDLESCRSIIHARAYSVEEIKEIWGVEVAGDEVDVLSSRLANNLAGLGYNAGTQALSPSTKKGQCLVIERYERPTASYPDGVLTIVGGGKLLHYGELPFLNGADGERGFPFIRQICNKQAGCFWGVSIIERVIPVQRSYNSVKNRKHEFLNRIAMGVMAVEDGSIDVENLEEEGLSPGKVLIYRQGSRPPDIMSSGSVPMDFAAEEDRLLSEFIYISGISEFMRNSSVPSSVTSGIALQLIIEQDDTRLTFSADAIRSAVKKLGQHILRLYKQFAKTSRLSRVVGLDGDVEQFYFDGSDISSDDIVFDTENEFSNTPAQKRSMVFDMLRAGLLHDENGNLDQRARVKVLDMLGFGSLGDGHDISQLHLKRAAKENLFMLKTQTDINEIDDHSLHIAEHTKFMLSKEYESQEKPSIKSNFLAHIRAHKAALAADAPVEDNNEQPVIRQI